MFKPFEKHRFWCDSCLNPWSDKIEQCIVKEFLNTIIMTFTLRSPFLPEPSMSFLQVSFDICVIIGLKNFYPYLDDCFQFEEPNLRFVCVCTWKSKIAGLTLSINYHPTTLLCSFLTNKLWINTDQKTNKAIFPGKCKFVDFNIRSVEFQKKTFTCASFSCQRKRGNNRLFHEEIIKKLVVLFAIIVEKHLRFSDLWKKSPW